MKWTACLLIGFFMCLVMPNINAQRTQMQTKILYVGGDIGWVAKDLSAVEGTGIRSSAWGEFPLKKNWSFVIGMGFSNLGLQSHFLDVTDGPNVEIVGPNLGVYRKGSFSYRYFTAPLLARYRRGNFYASAGLIPHFYFNQLVYYSNNYTIAPKDQIGDTHNPKDLRTPNIALSLGGGYQFKIQEFLDIFVEPRLNAFLGSTFKVGNESVSKTAISFNIGIRKTVVVQREVVVEDNDEEWERWREEQKRKKN